MPRIEVDSKPKPTWKDIQNLIMENLFCAVPEEVEHIKEEVNKILEEKKNVCEANKRNND